MAIINVLKAVKNREFWRLVRRKLAVCCIPNKNLILEWENCLAYRKLYRNWKHILDRGLGKVGKSEKSDKVWICWFQGYKAAPDLVKACIHSVKQNMPNKDIVILSDSNLHDYIKLPEYIEKKRKKGLIGAAHYSDLIRVELLCQYGGTWIDATVLCTSSSFPSYISELPLFVYKIMDLTRADFQPIVASSWLIAAESNQKILLMTRKLLYEYWKKENHLENYFLFHLFFAMAARKYQKEWEKVPFFNNHAPHTLQFELDKPYEKQRWEQILQTASFHKLTHHKEYSKIRESFWNYIIKNYLPS